MKLLSCCQNTWVVDTTSCYYYYMQCPAPAATGGLKGTVATKMTKIIGPLKGSLLIAARSGSLREKGHSSLTEKKARCFLYCYYLQSYYEHYENEQGCTTTQRATLPILQTKDIQYLMSEVWFLSLYIWKVILTMIHILDQTVIR